MALFFLTNICSISGAQQITVYNVTNIDKEGHHLVHKIIIIRFKNPALVLSAADAAFWPLYLALLYFT